MSAARKLSNSILYATVLGIYAAFYFVFCGVAR